MTTANDIDKLRADLAEVTRQRDRLAESLSAIVMQCDDRPRGATKNSPCIAQARAALASLSARSEK